MVNGNTFLKKDYKTVCCVNGYAVNVFRMIDMSLLSRIS